MDRHVTSVGVLFIFFGAQGVFISILVLASIIGGGMLSGDEAAISITRTVGLSIVCPFLLLEALKVVGGVGLLQRRPWARVPVLVLSFLSLFLIPPIGTAYGIYAIWVLMKDDTARLFAAGAQPDIGE